MINRIIGIDPSLTNTGWGIIDIDNSTNVMSFVADGTIKTKSGSESLQQRLKFICEELHKVIEKFNPNEAAMEESFVNVNARSSLILGMARGAVMLSISLKDIPITEYTPTKVKQAISGSGRADKNQVLSMVKVLLPSCRNPDSEHSADALAIAICHLHNKTFKNL